MVGCADDTLELLARTVSCTMLFMQLTMQCDHVPAVLVVRQVHRGSTLSSVATAHPPQFIARSTSSQLSSPISLNCSCAIMSLLLLLLVNARAACAPLAASHVEPKAVPATRLRQHGTVAHCSPIISGNPSARDAPKAHRTSCGDIRSLLRSCRGPQSGTHPSP